jgi:2-amino-4-hydroxy-6-hydroxymethyldihydropteridine diphosphokinase
MAQSNRAYLLIGGNIGDREEYLRQAREAIGQSCGSVLDISSVYETEPWGLGQQATFLNQALALETSFSADLLLKEILHAEERLGRKRDVKYGPRTIDIDILLFNEAVIDMPGLIIPHPQLQNRRFALAPLAEIASGKLHPVLNKTIAELLSECPDPLNVYKI